MRRPAPGYGYTYYCANYRFLFFAKIVFQLSL